MASATTDKGGGQKMNVEYGPTNEKRIVMLVSHTELSGIILALRVGISEMVKDVSKCGQDAIDSARSLVAHLESAYQSE